MHVLVNAGNCETNIKLYIRQSNSSLPSGQSLLLLHNFDRLTQVWLSLHLNSPGRHSTSLVTSNTSSYIRSPFIPVLLASTSPSRTMLNANSNCPSQNSTSLPQTRSNFNTEDYTTSSIALTFCVVYLYS